MEIAKTLKTVLNQDNVKNRFNEILGKKSQGFISSVMNIVNNNNMLQEADPQSVLNAAVVAATLDLPIDPNLGFSAIVPYRSKGKTVAQFQMMYKGFIQLAQRSGQYSAINAAPIYEGELISYDRVTEEIKLDYEAKKSDIIVGYVAYFRLINGFQKLKFWSIDELDKHGKRFSKSYQKNFGLWADKENGGFEAMCLKTVLKNILSKYGILSIDIQNAVKFDQSVVNDPEGEPEYIDTETEEVKEKPEAIKGNDNPELNLK